MSKTSGSRTAKKSAGERPVFDAIRKPVAPPGRALGNARPEERAHPAERKIKHKHHDVETED